MSLNHYVLLSPSEPPRAVAFSESTNNLRGWYKALGCSCVEHVLCRDSVYGRRLHLLVDEYGWYKDDPQLNSVASFLYGSYIVGKALVCFVGDDDIQSLPEDIIPALVDSLKGFYYDFQK